MQSDRGSGGKNRETHLKAILGISESKFSVLFMDLYGHFYNSFSLHLMWREKEVVKD